MTRREKRDERLRRHLDHVYDRAEAVQAARDAGACALAVRRQRLLVEAGESLARLVAHLVQTERPVARRRPTLFHPPPHARGTAPPVRG